MNERNDDRSRQGAGDARPQDEERLDALARDLLADYNEPERELDEQRREALWHRIQAARAGEDNAEARGAAPRAGGRSPERSSGAPRPHRLRRAAPWFAAAAVLVLGIGIGRMLPDGSGPTTGPVAEGDGPALARSEGDGGETPRWSQDTAEALYRLAARDYLLRTETLLTEFRQAAAHPSPEMNAGPGNAGRGTLRWAGDLLLEARLLLDSPAAADEPRLAALLRELELILAEIVQMADDTGGREQRMIRESIDDRSLLLRLREEMPARKDSPRA